MHVHVHVRVQKRTVFASVRPCVSKLCVTAMVRARQVAMRTVLLVNPEDAPWTGNVTVSPLSASAPWTACWNVAGDAVQVSILPAGAAQLTDVEVAPYGTTLVRCSAQLA